jgi:hypothetical protein
VHWECVNWHEITQNTLLECELARNNSEYFPNSVLLECEPHLDGITLCFYADPNKGHLHNRNLLPRVLNVCECAYTRLFGPMLLKCKVPLHAMKAYGGLEV